MKNENKKFKTWETALLLSLCLCLLTGVWAQGRSERLSSSLIRLHVLADSDTQQAQELKLRVRDSVLAYLEPRLRKAQTREEALSVLEREREGLESTAASAAEGQSVRVELGTESYPTRNYGSFSLPAGQYTSLRILIGEGAGRNWWCVVFPPLCTELAQAQEAMAALSPEDAELISTEDGVQLRFRILELWGELLEALGK